MGDISDQQLRNMVVKQFAELFKKGDWETLAAMIVDNNIELTGRLAELEAKK